MDELDLGLEPRKPKRITRPAGDRKDYTWAKYTAVTRRLCSVCIDETPKVDGVPIHAINRAMFTERGPEGTKWLCTRHKNERDVALRKPPKRSKK